MIEYRNVRGKDAKPGESDGKLHGRAAPFNSVTQIGGDKWGFREKIAPGAFKKSIKEGDIVLLDNHDSAKPIARQSAGTLRPMESNDGLDWDADPADTTYARDAVENARAGNYGGCSFGFEVIKDSWERGQGSELDIRTLEEVRLHEISVCTFPAYGDTDVQARSREQASLEAARESREKALGPIDITSEDKDQDESRKDSKKPYGDVAYADPKNGKYPIDTKEHAKAAWRYINQEKNAKKYPLNGVSLSSVKSKIRAACKKFGVQVSEQNAEVDVSELRSEIYDLYLRLGIITAEERDLLREDEDATDPYADEFYERDSQDGDADGSKAAGDDQDSDASDSDEGDKPCQACDDKGKDKSGNKCAQCGGSKAKNGDGGNHQTAGDEKEKKNASADDEQRDGEPGGNPTRTDDERLDTLRALRVQMMAEAVNS